MMKKVRFDYETPTTVMSVIRTESMIMSSGLPKIVNEVKSQQVEDLTVDTEWEVTWDAPE